MYIKPSVGRNIRATSLPSLSSTYSDGPFHLSSLHLILLGFAGGPHRMNCSGSHWSSRLTCGCVCNYHRNDIEAAVSLLAVARYDWIWEVECLPGWVSQTQWNTLFLMSALGLLSHLERASDVLPFVFCVKICTRCDSPSNVFVCICSGWCPELGEISGEWFWLSSLAESETDSATKPFTSSQDLSFVCGYCSNAFYLLA